MLVLRCIGLHDRWVHKKPPLAYHWCWLVRRCWYTCEWRLHAHIIAYWMLFWGYCRNGCAEHIDIVLDERFDFESIWGERSFYSIDSNVGITEYLNNILDTKLCINWRSYWFRFRKLIFREHTSKSSFHLHHRSFPLLSVIYDCIRYQPLRTKIDRARETSLLDTTWCCKLLREAGQPPNSHARCSLGSKIRNPPRKPVWEAVSPCRLQCWTGCQSSNPRRLPHHRRITFPSH